MIQTAEEFSAYVKRGGLRLTKVFASELNVTNSNATFEIDDSSFKVEIVKQNDFDKHWCEFKTKFNKTYSDCVVEQKK